MTRKEALDSIRANVADEDKVKHMLAAEAIMLALARRLGENEEEWRLTGLLHDIDIELLEGDTSMHGKLGADLARELGASEAMTHAILCHSKVCSVPRETKLDKALFCTDPLTRLIVAASAASGKGLADLKASSIRTRYNEESFAIDVCREQISSCSQIGLDLDELFKLGLAAMTEIADDLGLCISLVTTLSLRQF